MHQLRVDRSSYDPEMFFHQTENENTPDINKLLIAPMYYALKTTNFSKIFTLLGD